MKKITLLAIAGLSTAIMFSACSSKNNSNPAMGDTTGLAAFQQMKMKEAAKLEAQREAAAARKSYPAPAKTVVYTSSTANSAKVQEKKGWSKAAKYGVAGTAGGAVLGAVINKKDPVRGAVVGAVVLGGGGYIYGRSQDKKDGRVN